MSTQMIDWPSELGRTDPEDRESTSKFDTNFRKTERDLRKQMEMMEVDQWRLDHVTGSGGDPGVVLRWSQNETPHAVACDHYTSKRDNLRAVYLWIKETRKRGDRPVVTGDTDFAAARLMPPEEAEEVASRPPPHEVLDVAPDAPEGIVKAARREKMKTAHPDQGGSAEEKELVEWAARQMGYDGG